VSGRLANDTTDLLPACYRLVGDKSVTSWQLPRLQGSYGETVVMDCGLLQKPNVVLVVVVVVV